MNRAQRRTVKKKTSRLRIPSINEFDMLTDTQQMMLRNRCMRIKDWLLVNIILKYWAKEIDNLASWRHPQAEIEANMDKLLISRPRAVVGEARLMFMESEDLQLSKEEEAKFLVYMNLNTKEKQMNGGAVNDVENSI
jgi:hypothetical protein